MARVPHVVVHVQNAEHVEVALRAKGRAVQDPEAVCKTFRHAHEHGSNLISDTFSRVCQPLLTGSDSRLDRFKVYDRKQPSKQ